MRKLTLYQIKYEEPLSLFLQISQKDMVEILIRISSSFFLSQEVHFMN